MPGVFGGFHLTSGPDVHALDTAGMEQELIRFQHHMRTRRGQHVGNGCIGVLDPNIRDGLAACEEYPDRRITIAIFGEINHHRKERTPRVADRLAGWYGISPATATKRVAELHGAFCFAVHDHRDSSLLLATDRTASRPIHYCVINGALYFAPSLRGFLGLRGFSPKLSLGCAASFLANGSWIADATFFENVHSLPPASTLVVREGKVRVEAYWDMKFQEDAGDEGLEAYATALQPLIRSAVAGHLDSIPDKAAMVVPISGGYDSRAILATIRDAYDGPLRTITWGVNETDPHADGFIGRRVASAMGTDHLFIERSRSARLAHEVQQTIRQVDASIDDPIRHHGELGIMNQLRAFGCTDLFRGDEVFGYLGAVRSDAEALSTVGFVKAKDLGQVLSLIAPEWRDSARDEYNLLIEGFQKGAESMRDPTNRKDYFYFRGRLVHVLHRSSFYKMPFLNVRLPWLDPELLDFMRIVPARHRVHKAVFVRALEQMYPGIGDIPYATRLSLENWRAELRTDFVLREFVDASLRARSSCFDDVFDGDGIDFLFRTIMSGSLAPRSVDQIVRSSKSALRKLVPGLYSRLKRHALDRVPVPHKSPVSLLFRLVILKLWLGDLERHNNSNES
jgi:asparagine synthetase B (glutamine-hydrolysing)